MIQRSAYIIFVIFMLINFSVHAQQTPTDLIPTEVITTENVHNLQRITTLGDGSLIALDWHPNGEVLALARGIEICLLDSQLEITRCFNSVDGINDLAWDSTGTYLAIISDIGLHIWTYNSANNELISSQTIETHGTCVAWNTDDGILTAFFDFYDRNVSLLDIYTLQGNEFVLDEVSASTDYSDFLQAQCQADKDTSITTLTITDFYIVGRTYDAIQIGEVEENRRITERLGSLRDVAWQIPDETFTYIVDNQIVQFSINLYRENGITGELLRSSNLGTNYVNTLKWSPDGTQLLSGGSYSDTFTVWLNSSGFINGNISHQSIEYPRGMATYEARVRWLDNTRISFEQSDWYHGANWDVYVIDTESGERVYSIYMWLSYPEDEYPIFEWNPSYDAYMIVTDEGFKISRLLEKPELIGYNTETGDFGTDLVTKDYFFTDIPCEAYNWVDDRYFSCVGGDEEVIIDSFTGETGVEPPNQETGSTYQIDVAHLSDTVSVIIVDSSTEESVLKMNMRIPYFDVLSFGIGSFGDTGLMTRYINDGLHFWDIPSDEELFFLDDTSITSMSLHPDGHILAVGTSTGLVHLYGVPQSSE